jgi:hypothetical protein
MVSQSGNEGDVHRARDGLTMLQSIGDQSQSQRLQCHGCLFSGSPIRGYARQGRNIRQPAAILFAVILDGQREAGWRLWHESSCHQLAESGKVLFCEQNRRSQFA